MSRIMVSTFSRVDYSADQPINSVVDNPAWSAKNRGKMFFFLSPRSRLRIWSRETGSAYPFRASTLILHSQADSVWCCLPTESLQLSTTASIYLYETVNRHRVSPE